MVDFWQIIQNAAVEIVSPTTAAYALAALGLAIHFGYTGLLNFGQAGFMALGAYGYAISTLTFGFPVWGAVLVGVGASIIFALILGIPTLRLRADYLAIVTIAASEILRLIFTTNSLDAITGSADGLSAYKGGFAALNPIPPGTYGFGPFTMNEYDLWLRIVGWSIVIIGGLLAWQLMRSPWGRVIKGIREDEDAVRALGKNVYFYKMQALIIGGVFGTIGGMIFILPRAVVPANYATTLTFFIYTILLLGGAATILGPIVGSMIFWVLLSAVSGFVARAQAVGWFPGMSSVQAGQTRFIIVGIVLMLLVIFRPQGIFGNKKELAFVK
ncbi:MAG: branched-chain amino acid ABC transporter permease [Rhodoglobus sp.]